MISAMIKVILLAVVLIASLVWSLGFIYANDFKVHTKKLNNYHKVLLVFPHPDDEVLTTGGLIRNLSNNGSEVTLVILTKGERGNRQADYDESLKQIRTEEARRAATILGVSNLLHEDFGDGELDDKKPIIREYLQKVIAKTVPDLIITYDLSGLYGHPDHVAVSEIVTQLIQDTQIKLWYASFPKKVMSVVPLPEYMAAPSFKRKRSYPTHKVSIGADVFSKISAVNAYESQKESFSNSPPISWIPKEFFHSMQLFEYFHEVE